MEVAIVVHDARFDNGQGRYVLELARRLGNRARFRVFANTFPEVPVPGVEWVRVRAIRRRYALAILSFLVDVEQRLRRAGRILVHAQGLSCWGADLATVHVCNAARQRVLSSADRGSRLFARIMMPIEARFYRQPRLAQLITMSHRLETEVREHYGWRGPVSVVPHGTDAALFRPAVDDLERQGIRSQLGLPAESWVWLFIGEAVKGLSTVLRALPRFPRATLLVVSRSDPAPYVAESNLHGVASRVVFRGFDPQPERVYRAADVLVHPTQYESFGLVVTEAMASGLPVIVGTEAGVAELITDGIDGLRVPANNPSALEDRLLWLEADPVRATRLGESARATVSRYSWDRCAEATWSVYESVWAAKRGSAGPATLGR